jgi:hypothetical protein
MANSKLAPNGIEFFTNNDNIVNLTAVSNSIILTGETPLHPVLLKGVKTPIDPGDAANKKYVDDQITGDVWKDPVKLASSINVDVADIQNNTVTGKVGSIDGVAINVGDRVLFTNQTESKHNGIYVITKNSDEYIFSRSSDFGLGKTAPGVTVFVTDGMSNKGNLYQCTSVSATVNDVDEISFNIVGNKVDEVYVVSLFHVDISTLVELNFIDGISVRAGNRVLLTGQNNPVENGIYIIGTSITTPTRRSAEFSKGSCPVGVTVFVSNGDLHKGMTIVCLNNNYGDKVDVNPITFVSSDFLNPIKRSVKAVLTDSTSTLDYGQLKNNLVVDGVTLVKNDRLLISKHSIPGMIGIYIIGETVGKIALDYFPHFNPFGTTVFVEQGNVNAGITFVYKTIAPTIFGFTNDIKTPGSVTASNFLASSDRRLKMNFENIQDSLEKIRNINGVKFDWRESGLPDVGFVAQEVQSVFPEVVMTGEDGFLKVDYARVVVLLLEAVKTLDDIVKKNDQRLQKLEM